MKQIRLIITAAMTGWMAMGVGAAEPSGYYSTCQGKKGQALLSQLSAVISNHTTIGYNGLWDLYKTSDVDENGKIWDMYSTKRWKPGSEQCGNYSGIGDCYNREHSMPKSWFNDASPMYSDGFHIYPTDGYVNSQRSNHPFGECENGKSVPSSGGVKPLGRLGKSTYPGYSGTVFEPDDQYKGDFARTYFYMAACYNSRISSWNSDMLAGNSFPVFKSWAIEMLLKWHRQDPVSDKERNRNEAVYARQRNRNPFIDHPELAEHIWGNKSSQGWGSGSSEPVAAFTAPVNGSTLNLGRTAVNTSVSSTLNVRGTGFTDAVSVSLSGTGFSASTSSLSAAAVNAGTTLTVNFRSASAGSHTGTLTLRSTGVAVSVNLQAETVSGIPVNDATAVTTDAFTVNWTNIGDASTTYQLYVEQDGDRLTGYPRSVKAADGSFRVTSLDPGTTYTYWLTGMGVESRHLSITTLRELPELFVDADEDLVFTSTPGVPSTDITVRVEALNTLTSLKARINAPFELSTDRSSWATEIDMAPDDDHFYVRLNGNTAGTFHSTLSVIADGDMLNDNLRASGTITTGGATWMESFENILTAGYHGEDLQGDAASWTFVDAGVFDDGREVHSGKHGARFNTADGGTITMTGVKRGGIGTLTLWARRWDTSDATLTAEYSTDGGRTWRTALNANPGQEWQQFTANLNVEGGVALRFVKHGASRMCLDEITATNFGAAAIDQVNDSRKWEAYNRDGRLILENFTSAPIEIAVYSIEGRTMMAGEVPAGISELRLPAGIYIVVDEKADVTRRVVIRP